jgi:hypothetical protein
VNFNGIFDNLRAERGKHLISLPQCISQSLHLITDCVLISVSAADRRGRRPTALSLFGRRSYLDRSGLRRHFWTGLSFLFTLEEIVGNFLVGLDLLFGEPDVLLVLRENRFLARLF